MKNKKYIKILLIFAIIFSLIFGVFFFILSSSLNTNFFEKRSYHETQNVRNGLNKIANIMEDLASRNFIECNETKQLQDCIIYNKDKLIVIPKGLYSLEKKLELPQESKIFIRDGAIISISDTAIMPNKGGSVIGIEGKISNKHSNITLIHNGMIDGNNSIHSYDKSGNEGIKIDYGDNIVIFGKGQISNVSGDGIDFDATNNSLVMGISTTNNDGTGVHFGSPRPFNSSKNNQVIGIFSSNNGYLHNRNGLDVSYPNMNSATYAWNIAKNNYRNWSLVGSGSSIFRGVSIDGSVEDDISGANLAEINDKFNEGSLTNLSYIKILLKRDINHYILGRDINPYFFDLKYFRKITSDE